MGDSPKLDDNPQVLAGRKAAEAALPPGFCSRLLAGLAPSEITAVLAAAKQRRISHNQVLQYEGHPTSHLFLLVTGLAAFYKTTPEGSKLFLRWITPGDTFGLPTLLQTQPQPSFTTVQALRGGYALVWERASAYALASQIPRLRENAIALASDYVASSTDVLVARARQTAQQRLARVLVESARHIGRAGREGIEFGLTNEKLAEMASVSLFTASRQLAEWQRQGILTRSRGKILLRAPERLDSQYL
jgi:CRP-like cAMP-binding protein